jgi:flagellin-like protein
MKKIWAIRKDSEAVSPVIATILMVAITVVLAAVLYVMVLGFGGTSQTTPALQIPSVTTISSPDGKKCSLTQPTAEATWTDVKIVLQLGGASVDWEPVSSDLDGGSLVTAAYGSETLNSVAIYLNVTDLGGDGNIDNGDYFTLTGALSGSYTILMVYEPTNALMTEKTFTA